jgi:hypothetical protein
MSAEYQKAHTTYRTLAVKSLEGDAQARKDKAKVMQEIVAIERQSAKDGVNLSAVYKGDRVTVESTNSPSKRSLQEEYVRNFDDEKLVKIDGKEQSLRAYHSKRLLGR